MPMTVVSTVVPTARYMEFPRADRKLPCSTVWKFLSVSGPPPPMVRLPCVLNAVAGSHGRLPHVRQRALAPQETDVDRRQHRPHQEEDDGDGGAVGELVVGEGL